MPSCSWSCFPTPKESGEGLGMVMSSPHSRPITTVPALLCEDNLPDSGQKLLSLKITPSPALPCLPRAPLSVPWEHIFTNHLHSCLVLGSASEEDPSPPPPTTTAKSLGSQSLKPASDTFQLCGLGVESGPASTDTSLDTGSPLPPPSTPPGQSSAPLPWLSTLSWAPAGVGGVSKSQRSSPPCLPYTADLATRIWASAPC